MDTIKSTCKCWDSSLETSIDHAVKTDERYFVYFCCEKGSLLSNPVHWTKVKINDVTKEQDFTNPKTVLDIIWKLEDLVMCSFTALHALEVLHGSG